jgi:hypothetical protein
MHLRAFFRINISLQHTCVSFFRINGAFNTPACRSSAPTVQMIVAQGNALGIGWLEKLGALKGRLNS